MSDAARAERAPTDWSGEAMQKRIRRRYSAERRFKLLGLGAVVLSAGFLALLLVIMLGNGIRGFTAAEVKLDIDFPASGITVSEASLRGPNPQLALASADLDGVINRAAEAQFGPQGAAFFSGAARL